MGSSLIATAFSTINSLIFRPIMDISVDGNPIPIVGHFAHYTISYNNYTAFHYTNYTISLKNIGYVPATHLRLTMAYPSAKILGAVIEQEDENMTVWIAESEGNSVVAFLKRLAPAASISINVKINGVGNHTIISIPDMNTIKNITDYGDDPFLYTYLHKIPYSIVAMIKVVPSILFLVLIFSL